MSKVLRKEKCEAIRMRKAGASYSQIKRHIKVSKSSLSLWLRNMPLPEKRLKELRDFSAVRIERYRETRRKTREARWALVRSRAAKEIGHLSARELFIAGLFLYWGEGSKTTPSLLCVSNTDPAMLRFFISWLELLGISKKKLRVKIHLYRDMNVKKELQFWSDTLSVPLTQFTKPYIKDSKQSDLTYPQRFTHGTGNILLGGRDISEKVFMSLDYIRSSFADGLSL